MNAKNVPVKLFQKLHNQTSLKWLLFKSHYSSANFI